MLKSFVAVSAGLIGGAHAFWRMECPGRVGVARIDPIVNPGEISMHAHSIHGSSAFAETVTTESLQNGDCTSCRVTEDKSAYWHPSLYFQDSDTGEFELVKQVGGMLAYYLLYGDNITAFPANFRMLSGTNDRRTYTAGDPSQPDPEKSLWESLGQTDQDTLAQRALGFNCLNYAKDPEGTLYRHYLPDKAYLDANCADGIRFEIMFPSCWKGGDETDSDDHKSHVAFPDLVMTGTCPDDYPVRIPSLMYEVIWDTASYTDRNGQFVIANGDTTGYGYHADFIMGWDSDFLQTAVDTCTNASGRIEDCPVFNVVDESEAETCEMTLPDALAKEDVEGPMSELPGGVQITYEDGAGESASASVTAPTSTGSIPTLTYAPGETPSNSASPLPGQAFKEVSMAAAAAAVTTTTTIITSSALPSSSSYDAVVGVEAIPTTAIPTTAAPVATTSETASFYSTQFVTNGNVVSKILWEEEVVYVTELEEETVVVTVTSTAVVGAPTAAARRRRWGAHMHGHGHRHR
ncbi:hypothetical protein BGZ61DRAFT_474462 [Ilyonectria robusta]|uniref:uncharacterized protein n=1 Tax=Ilyonectria robusta TaxID=1079257 RepID=UPI001E8D23CB|nr:uncharacterized protein BGZ61DRAFT_474462 [Ilyonectria robusta]KAH8733819.1 hypothetical protein BGZ61DRAFT_474462 [Ilyonectria robusta]